MAGVKQKSAYGDWGLRLYVILVFVFLFSPIAVVILFSFQPGRYPSLPLAGLTLNWYRELVRDGRLLDCMRNSFLVAGSVSLISTTLGFMGAYALRSYKLKVESLFVGFMSGPLTVPGLLLGLSLLIFLNSILSIQNSLYSVIISHTVFCGPFAMFILRARLRTIPATFEEAAWDLGAGTWQTIKEVILPLSAPGLIAALLLTFTLSFDEFIISWFVCGFQETLPVRVWNMMRGGIKPTINAVGSIIVVLSITCLLVGEYFMRKKSA